MVHPASRLTPSTAAIPGRRRGRWHRGFPQLVPDHRDPLRLAVDVDGHALSSSAVDDPASLEAISVRRERLVRITEVDAGLAAPSDAAVANEIVRITVTQGHAMVEVLDQVPLVSSGLCARAEVDAIGTALDPIATDNRTLRPRTRVVAVKARLYGASAKFVDSDTLSSACIMNF